MSRFLKTLILASLALLPAGAVAQQQLARYDRAADPHGFTVFMQEGGWCWFQDPRAVIHDRKLFAGGVRGNGSGPALAGVYDLTGRKPLGTVLMQDDFDRDDHNSPVFHVRGDGSLVAFYAKHHREPRHYYRVSEPGDPLRWGAEMILEHTYPEAGKVTYMNLLPLSAEGRLYNFFRGIAFNPCFVTSADDGRTWGEPTHFIKNEVKGFQRPYTRYAGNGIDTIHVAFTDAHPQNFGNSIYHAIFRGGKFYRSGGRLIKDFRMDGPLLPSEADLVFQGGGGSGRGKRLSAEKSAWVSSIALDAQERPHIAYSFYLANSDLRFRLASWDGSKWIDREIARAGKALYETQSSYTGLVSLDPGDPSIVAISTDADPSTGKDTGGRHEIYRAEVGTGDDIGTIRWKPVTAHSPVRNIRPLFVRDGKTRVLAWLRGDFQTFTDYQLDVVGLIEQAP